MFVIWKQNALFVHQVKSLPFNRHPELKWAHRKPIEILETFIELVLQNPFNVIDTKRTKLAERSFNPIFDEELSFALPVKVSLSDLTLDLVFLGKSSLHHHPIVLSVLTLSKHTDWFPVRRFWTELERNPNVRMKDRFLFEGRLFEWMWMKNIFLNKLMDIYQILMFISQISQF